MTIFITILQLIFYLPRCIISVNDGKTVRLVRDILKLKNAIKMMKGLPLDGKISM